MYIFYIKKQKKYNSIKELYYYIIYNIAMVQNKYEVNINENPHKISLIYEKLKIDGIVDKNGLIWIPGKLLCVSLELVNPKYMIGSKVNITDKLKYEELLKQLNVNNITLTYNERQMIWINNNGIIKLIEISNHVNKEAVAKWLKTSFKEIKQKCNNDNSSECESDDNSSECESDDNSIDNITEVKNNKNNKVSVIMKSGISTINMMFNAIELHGVRDINGILWFVGNEICKILEYIKPRKAVKDHVSDINKMKFKDVKNKLSNLKCSLNGDNTDIVLSNGNEDNTIWINEHGLYELTFSSKMKLAKEFRNWITSEVLPSIRKTGQYKINNEYSFFDDHDINDYDKKRVVYMADIGEHEIDGEIVHLAKFGKTRNYNQREDAHSNHFDKFIIKHIELCNDHDELETKLKKYLKSKDLLVKYEINDKNLIELFRIDNNTIMEEAKNKLIKYATDIHTTEFNEKRILLQYLKEGRISERTMLKLLNLPYDDVPQNNITINNTKKTLNDNKNNNKNNNKDNNKENDNDSNKNDLNDELTQESNIESTEKSTEESNDESNEDKSNNDKSSDDDESTDKDSTTSEESENNYDHLNISNLRSYDIVRDSRYTIKITNIVRKTELINEIYNARVLSTKEFNKLERSNEQISTQISMENRVLINKYILTNKLKIRLNQDIIKSWWNQLHVIDNILHVLDVKKLDDKITLTQHKYLKIILQVFGFESIIDFKHIAVRDDDMIARMKAANLNLEKNQKKVYTMFANRINNTPDKRRNSEEKNESFNITIFTKYANTILHNYGVNVKSTRYSTIDSDNKATRVYQYLIEPHKVGLKKMLNAYDL